MLYMLFQNTSIFICVSNVFCLSVRHFASNLSILPFYSLVRTLWKALNKFFDWDVFVNVNSVVDCFE